MSQSPSLRYLPGPWGQCPREPTQVGSSPPFSLHPKMKLLSWDPLHSGLWPQRSLSPPPESYQGKQTGPPLVAWGVDFHDFALLNQPPWLGEALVPPFPHYSQYRSLRSAPPRAALTLGEAWQRP